MEKARIRPENKMETIERSLIRILMEGPEVSLKGSPTVSLTTAAFFTAFNILLVMGTAGIGHHHGKDKAGDSVPACIPATSPTLSATLLAIPAPIGGRQRKLYGRHSFKR